MQDSDLEKVLSTKIKPMIDEAMHKFLGVTVDEISLDITDKIAKGPILDVPINTLIPFKEAKKQFKKQYILRLLQLNQGNISTVAQVAKVDRRSIHRFIIEMKINIENLRKQHAHIDYLKQAAIKQVIDKSLDVFKDTIKSSKLKKLYEKSKDLSAEILKEIPQQYFTLDEAEKEFEKQYIKKALEENNQNISKTARKIGLRFETLHRKMKELKI